MIQDTETVADESSPTEESDKPDNQFTYIDEFLKALTPEEINYLKGHLPNNPMKEEKAKEFNFAEDGGAE